MPLVRYLFTMIFPGHGKSNFQFANIKIKCQQQRGVISLCIHTRTISRNPSVTHDCAYISVKMPRIHRAIHLTRFSIKWKGFTKQRTYIHIQHGHATTDMCVFFKPKMKNLWTATSANLTANQYPPSTTLAFTCAVRILSQIFCVKAAQPADYILQTIFAFSLF